MILLLELKDSQGPIWSPCPGGFSPC